MAQTEFNNKRFLKLFGTISLSSLFIFSTSIFAADLYSKKFDDPTLGKGAQIASLSVETYTKNEAAAAVTKAIEDWRKGTVISLVYNGEKITVPSEAFMFDVDSSIEQANGGNSASLAVQVNEEAVREAVKGFKEEAISDVLDEARLFHHVKQIGATLDTKAVEVQLSEFMTAPGQPEEEVSRVEVQLKGQFQLIEAWSEKLNGTEIKPEVPFSLIQTMTERGATPQDSPELNILASVIYEATLKTNFTYLERHTTRELPDFTSLGHESAVDTESKDLVLQNPNATSYKLNLTFDDNKLRAAIVGVPFPFTYDITIEKKTFEPKTIIQFSKTLPYFSSINVLRQGKEGFLGTVYRIAYGKSGEQAEKVKLFEDFYPPVHEIEQRGFPLPPTNESENPVVPPPGSEENPLPYPWYPYPIPGLPGTPDVPETPEQPDTPVEDPENPDDAQPDEDGKTRYKNSNSGGEAG
ncbi:VanW family protein [Fictibacillus aquaticus]|uniref:G5 domain-containing protein n=1 Tax=Fictibacillus aquaticus TaxID=2021314 RepID=A0A235FEU3_9BACL|nr:VanW family protein [Fictibacillus aquaticus]OYD59732.1 hypothetical protein CGZ90_07585 [Fictibacillus aquaticus]